MPSSGFRGIFIEIIGDAKSYIRAAEQAIGMNDRLTQSNTLIAKSYAETGVSSQESAKLTVAASIKSTEAIKAQALALRELAATSTGATSERAALLAANAESKYARALGGTTVATQGLSTASKTGERDLNKLVRGGLAGSGAFSALGRSLAFASSGFIAFAAGATIIAKSISAARALEVAQRQVNRQLETSGKTFKQYGAQIDSATGKLSHIAGFTRIDLLGAFGFAARATGNVSNSLKLLSIAADVARGRGLNLQSSMIALTKAVGGSSTALRRLGIIVPKTAKGWDAINFVAAKFAGQARAGTTTAQRFGATLVTTEEIIGRALLPTVNKLLTSLGNWFQKMNETGKLQKDVNKLVRDAGDIFHTFAGAVKDVDKITGGFKNTLEALIALKFASVLASWTRNLAGVATGWGNVAKAAEGAAAAQTTAVESGVATGGLAGLRATAGARVAGAAGTAASAALPLAAAAIAFKIITNTPQYKAFVRATQPQGQSTGDRIRRDFGDLFQSLPKDIHDHVITPLRQLNDFLQNDFGTSVPVNIQFLRTFRDKTFGSFATQAERPRGVGGGGAGGPFGNAKPLTQYFKTFNLRFGLLLAQAQAQLTKSTADDVAVARRIVADIKKKIDQGQLHGQALLTALGLEASAVATIQSAEAAAAQKRAAAAQAEKAKILAQIENSINPLNLQIQLAREQAATQNRNERIKELATLKKQRQAARKALASGRLSAQQQLEALNQIIALNQQIASTAQSLKKKVLGGANAFRQASTRALTAGLGLTPDERRRLRARLSQLGPGGTIPGTGTGADGYIINPDTGRPIIVHTHLNIDGKRVADNTTRHQQKHRRRNPGQRRGPHAATGG